MPEPIKHVVEWFIARLPYTTVCILCLVFLIKYGFPMYEKWRGSRKTEVDIKKGEVDIAKGTLEVKKLEKEDRTVVLATEEEIKTYDPKTASLISIIQERLQRLENMNLALVVIILTWLLAKLFQHL